MEKIAFLTFRLKHEVHYKKNFYIPTRLIWLGKHFQNGKSRI